VRVSYIDMCCDVCHIIFFLLFVPHSVESMSEKTRKIREGSSGKTRGR
jgi:hypothetical protein